MADISKIQLPDGTEYNFKDDTSGYIKSPNLPYFTCSTGAGTTAKVGTLQTGTFEAADLVKGAQILVKFTNSNTVASPTFNANSTGAKSIKRYGTTAPSTSAATSWNAGNVLMLVYDGSYWQIADWINTSYSAMTTTEIAAGTGTSSRVITPANLKVAIQTWDHVKSVNGQTGNVTLSIPENTSDLTNDSGFITASTAPVTSVNNKTGNVTLTASDVSAVDTSAVGAANGVAPLDSSGKIDSSYLPPASASVSDVRVNSTSVVSNNVANIPLASTTKTGVVSTVMQSFTGEKTFHDQVNVIGNAAVRMSSGSETEAVGYQVEDFNGSIAGDMIMTVTLIDGDKYPRRFRFRQYGLVQSTCERQSYCETYSLPAGPLDLTDNANYDIITTKNPHAIPTETLSVTAGTNVTITQSEVKRSGNIVQGYIKFTTSAQINAYAYVVTGLPAFDVSSVFPLLSTYNGILTTASLYCDRGNAGLRVGAANLPAGSYAVSFSYIAQ